MSPEVEQAAEQLASRYFNSAGVISCQFVIKLKIASKEVQDAVNTKLIAKGLPPYDLEGKKTRKRDRGTHRATEPKTLSAEEIQKEGDLLNVLNEVRLDKEIIQSFLTEADTTEAALQQQLCELRGTPFTGSVNDPFRQIYKAAHDHARHNKEELVASTRCGCFFCRAIFDPKVPLEFVESDTALCPSCGIDAVIGDKAGYELTEEFLLAMFKRWFAIPIRIRARVAAPPIMSPSVTDRAPQSRDPEPVKATPVEFVPPPHLVEDETDLFGKGGNLLSSLPEDPEEDEGDGRDEEYQSADNGADPLGL